jgi:DNA polymerase III delta prime subunit
MSLTQFLWTEAYRPKTVDECILPENIRTTAKSFVAQGNLPNLLFSGGPGMGKTTLALAMCRELGITPMFINGSEESGIDMLRTKVKNFASTLSMDGTRKMIILDEADYLNPNSTQPGLRSMMEEFAINCGFILTCNYSNRIIRELKSRCIVVEFNIPKDERRQLMAQTLGRLETILTTEGVTFKEDVLVQAIKRYWPDVRKMINEMQRACVDGQLTPSILGQHNDVQFEPLWAAIRARNYKAARTWIGEYADLDPRRFYRAVYDWAHENAVEKTLPPLIILLADYQYRHLGAIDPHVHLSAFVLEVMNNGEWK